MDCSRVSAADINPIIQAAVDAGSIGFLQMLLSESVQWRSVDDWVKGLSLATPLRSYREYGYFFYVRLYVYTRDMRQKVWKEVEKSGDFNLKKLWDPENSSSDSDRDLVLPYIGMGGCNSSPTKRLDDDFAKRKYGILGSLFAYTRLADPDYLKANSYVYEITSMRLPPGTDTAKAMLFEKLIIAMLKFGTHSSVLH